MNIFLVYWNLETLFLALLTVITFISPNQKDYSMLPQMNFSSHFSLRSYFMYTSCQQDQNQIIMTSMKTTEL